MMAYGRKKNITEEIKEIESLNMTDIEAGEITILLKVAMVNLMMQYSHYFMALMVKMVQFKGYLKFLIYHMLETVY